MKIPEIGRISPTLENCIQESPISGIAVAMAVGSGDIQTITSGADSKGVPISALSLFPLASITKLAVALTILRLSDEGLLSVEDELRRFVPQAAAAEPGVTLRRLLTHAAGIPPDFPVDGWKYDENWSWEKMKTACLKVVPDTPPGTRVLYDNLGYGLLAIVIERIAGLVYTQAVKQQVFEPLGLNAYLGEEPPQAIVYLDDPGDPNAGTPIALWNSPFWCKLGDPWGGMIATPASTVSLIRAFTGFPEGFLKPDTAQGSIQDQTGGLGGGFSWQQWTRCPWGLGSEIILDGMQHWMDPGMRSGTIGHAGYSGCCSMYDSKSQVFWSVHGTSSAAVPWFANVFGKIRAAILEIIE